LRSTEHLLNSMIADVAFSNGALYVDTYASSVGHDLCQLAGVRWVEGIVPAQPAYPIHVNANGMANDARTVLATLGVASLAPLT
jgi:hypothetical protein